jgi:hypothetical protein
MAASHHHDSGPSILGSLVRPAIMVGAIGWSVKRFGGACSDGRSSRSPSRSWTRSIGTYDEWRILYQGHAAAVPDEAIAPDGLGRGHRERH